MSSQQSTGQARRNGALAAGTKSPEGIKKSSMNALRHGLTAKSLVLATESQVQFEELLKNYVEFYSPSNTIELDLVHDMVTARWRLARTRSIETVTLDRRIVEREANKSSRDSDIPRSERLAVAVCYLAGSGKSLDLLLRYETTYNRAFDRAQKALEKMQKARNAETATPESYETNRSPVDLIPTANIEPEASTPGIENCETNPAPQTPHQIDVANETNPTYIRRE